MNFSRHDSYCPFCEAAASNLAEKKWYNKPLYETENFVVLPSLGALVEEWMLIAPRKHLLNSSHIPVSVRGEFSDVLALARDQLKGCSTNVLLFEHGPSRKESLVGCGIDHAHVHCVSLPFDIAALLNEDSDDFKWQASSRIGYLPSTNRDYLVFEDARLGAYISHPKNAVSQFFRRLIATKLGVPDKYSYRTHLFLHNAQRTVTRFGSPARNGAHQPHADK